MYFKRKRIHVTYYFPTMALFSHMDSALSQNFSIYKSLRLLEIFGSEGIFLFAKKKLKKNSSMYFKRK